MPHPAETIARIALEMPARSSSGDLLEALTKAYTAGWRDASTYPAGERLAALERRAASESECG